ncbi:hypothetical protein AHAS_Ahas14G0061700 [Arachis hypogaea]
MLPYIREAGFGYAVELRDFMFDGCLISAFVERWRPKTHTFHLLLVRPALHLRMLPTILDCALPESPLGVVPETVAPAPDMGVG